MKHRDNMSATEIAQFMEKIKAVDHSYRDTHWRSDPQVLPAHMNDEDEMEILKKAALNMGRP